MPDNNMMILVGLGAAALWFMNRGGSQEDQADQLTGASMMAAGEGTAPDAPFQAYSAPANPVFFFNQGGQMAKVPGSNVPRGASSDEDIGIYPGGQNRPELEFTVARSVPPAGTSDISPTTPEFAGTAPVSVTPATVWDDPAQSAAANFMPTLAIQDVAGGIEILGANVDIASLSSKETFRAENIGTGFGFHTTADVLGEYVRGFTGSAPSPAGPTAVISQTVPVNAPDWAIDQWWDEG